MPSASRADLTRLLHPSQMHEIGAAAQALRTERFGLRSSVPFLAHRRLEGAPAWCALCGLPGGQADDEAQYACTDLHVQLPAGAPLLDCIPTLDDAFATVQVGTASDWIEAADDPLPLLREAHARGLRVLSDGILPRVHPARGAEAGQRWRRFWTAAAELGFCGHATVLQQGEPDDEALLDQIDAIAQLQDEHGIFRSVRLVVDAGDDFGGVQDSLLTHGIDDLRALAACRIGLESIEHLSFAFDRSDLKMAHIALASGADDLEGHLRLLHRAPRDEANSNDLSVDELGRWMREAGFTPVLRNGAFATKDFPQAASLESA